jgi:uncharacterized protein YaeQ
MALGATMFRFSVDVSDVDRGVYTSEELTMARHPSETDALMITRVLAWALEYVDGIVMGRGLAFPDEPALSVAGERGGLALWVEVGAPVADRVHRAAKMADEVRIYTARDVDLVLGALRGRKIHNAQHVQVIAFPHAFMQALEQRLDRRNVWSVVRNEGLLYVTIGADTIECTPTVHGME